MIFAGQINLATNLNNLRNESYDGSCDGCQSLTATDVREKVSKPSIL